MNGDELNLVLPKLVCPLSFFLITLFGASINKYCFSLLLFLFTVLVCNFFSAELYWSIWENLDCFRSLFQAVKDPDFELRRGPGSILLTQLTFLPSVISSFFTQNKEGGPSPRSTTVLLVSTCITVIVQ